MPCAIVCLWIWSATGDVCEEASEGPNDPSISIVNRLLCMKGAYFKNLDINKNLTIIIQLYRRDES